MATDLMDLLYDFVKARMSEKEQRKIINSSNILYKLEDDVDSLDDIKEELYTTLLYKVNWSSLIQRIQNDLGPDSEDEEEEKDIYENESEDDEVD